MKLTMLGTGNAIVTECYNTCFVLEDGGKHLMVDGGGGSTILAQLKHAGFNWADMRHIFVTHKHVDHLLGIVWMIRMICQSIGHGGYKGEAFIYSHAEVLELLRDMAGKLLRKDDKRHIDGRLHLVELADGQTLDIIGHQMTFFDIGSTKARQFGFSMDLDDDKRLVCCGDEPLSEAGRPYARGAEWMLHRDAVDSRRPRIHRAVRDDRDGTLCSFTTILPARHKPYGGPAAYTQTWMTQAARAWPRTHREASQ